MAEGEPPIMVLLPGQIVLSFPASACSWALSSLNETNENNMTAKNDLFNTLNIFF